jgi:hypothetical protein
MVVCQTDYEGCWNLVKSVRASPNGFILDFNNEKTIQHLEWVVLRPDHNIDIKTLCQLAGASEADPG